MGKTRKNGIGYFELALFFNSNNYVFTEKKQQHRITETRTCYQQIELKECVVQNTFARHIKCTHVHNFRSMKCHYAINYTALKLKKNVSAAFILINMQSILHAHVYTT